MNDIHAYLNSFTNFEHKLNQIKPNDINLSQVQEILDLLGNPQHNLRVIHVAGTKGKGSTCAFLSHILALSGCRVGLYTSPHLHRINERIRVLDPSVIESHEEFSGMITDDQLAHAINVMRLHIVAMNNRGIVLTYFEVLTVVAILFFSRQSVDWVVLETGLGGRLDATNAIESLIAVLTPISLDHTHILGNTISEIATQKAGIIKNSRQRVIMAPQLPEAMGVILNRCREFGIPSIIVDVKKYTDLNIALRGDHQKLNAATAVTVIELLRQWGHKITDEHIERGLRFTQWPGRFEVISKRPVTIVDCAHNLVAAQALVETIKQQYPNRRAVLVLGLSTDKDIVGVCHELRAIAETIILTKANHPRAHAFKDQEAGQLFGTKTWFVTEDVSSALNLARAKIKEDDIIIITGSMFVVAEARAMSTHLN